MYINCCVRELSCAVGVDDTAKVIEVCMGKENGGDRLGIDTSVYHELLHDSRTYKALHGINSSIHQQSKIAALEDQCIERSGESVLSRVGKVIGTSECSRWDGRKDASPEVGQGILKDSGVEIAELEAVRLGVCAARSRLSGAWDYEEERNGKKQIAP